MQQLLVNPEAERTLQEGKQYLQKAIEQDSIEVKSLLRFFPAIRRGNDIVLTDDADEQEIILPMLRSQSVTGHYRCLADYYDEEKPTPIGLFTIACQPKQQPVDEASRLMRHAVCSRLTEACAQWLSDSVACSYDDAPNAISPLRVAFGYATCPDHSLKRPVFDALDAEKQLGIALNDHYSIQPSTAICGLFVYHPEARYFPVGRIDKEQLADYCQRRGITIAEGEQLLSKYITK